MDTAFAFRENSLSTTLNEGDFEERSYGYWPKDPVTSLGDVVIGVPGEASASSPGGGRCRNLTCKSITAAGEQLDYSETCGVLCAKD